MPRFSRWTLGTALMFVFSLAANFTPPATAQRFRPVVGHAVRNLQHFPVRYLHSPQDLELLARLRREVRSAVAEGRPATAVEPLRRITALEPHDYFAWEFLSYTYAVLGDVASAANVDLDTVAYFEFIPAAAPQVSRAMTRLQSFDPGGWQARVQARRTSHLPQVPLRAIDGFIDAFRPSLTAAQRIAAHTRVEMALTSRAGRIFFIKHWHELSDRGPGKEETGRRQVSLRTLRQALDGIR